MNLIDQTIGDIVASHYQAAGVFHKYGIDFCCGGGVSLAQACRKRNLDPDVLVRELEVVLVRETAPGQDFASWSTGDLIDHIVRSHHGFVRMKTAEIAAYSSKVATVHEASHPETVQVRDLFAQLADAMAIHMAEEESIVFPMIRTASEDPKWRADLAAELDHMHTDHDEAGAMMSKLREITNGFAPPDDACATYRILYRNLAGFEADLHQHVHLENNILFKRF